MRFAMTSNTSIRSEQHVTIGQLADRIDAIWQRTLDLSPYILPEDLG